MVPPYCFAITLKGRAWGQEKFVLSGEGKWLQRRRTSPLKGVVCNRFPFFGPDSLPPEGIWPEWNKQTGPIQSQEGSECQCLQWNTIPSARGRVDPPYLTRATCVEDANWWRTWDEGRGKNTDSLIENAKDNGTISYQSHHYFTMWPINLQGGLAKSSFFLQIQFFSQFCVTTY